jgi:predicted dehydrogenase
MTQRLVVASSRLQAFSDYRELLASCELDAAVICLPNDLHAQATLACFERGLHVYVEKPLATTLEDGLAMVAARKRAGTVGAVGYNLRFHPLVARLRSAVQAGELGDPVAVHTVFCAARRELPPWKRRRSSGGGALLDLACHHVDLIRYVFDSEVTSVHALRRDVETEDDTAVLTLRLASGPLVTTLVSLAAVEEDRVGVYGTRGGLVFDRYRSTRLAFVPAARPSGLADRLRAGLGALGGVAGALGTALRPPREASFEAALAAFAVAVRGGAWTGADFDDGLRSLAVLTAAESAAARAARTASNEAAVMVAAP